MGCGASGVFSVTESQVRLRNTQLQNEMIVCVQATGLYARLLVRLNDIITNSYYYTYYQLYYQLRLFRLRNYNTWLESTSEIKWKVIKF